MVRSWIEQLHEEDDWYSENGGGWTAACILFTDHVNLTTGRSLERYIRRHKLGTCYKNRPKMNDNTGNRIQVWIFNYDKKRMKAFGYKKKWIRVHDRLHEDDLPRW